MNPKTPEPAPMSVAPTQPSGPPRWTYTLAAIVGAVGVVWAVVSHFVPKAGTAASAAPSSTTITVNGNGSLATQTMTGGVIHIGQPPAASASVPAVQAAKPTP
jgi:hypothetical protein